MRHAGRRRTRLPIGQGPGAGLGQGFFSDPYSLRSTEISDRTVVGGVSVICVGFNGKNAYGAYTGIHRTPFEVRGAQLVHASRSYAVNTDTCRAPEIRMRPFPELSAIR